MGVEKQLPMEEAAERIAESIPARTIPFLVAIQDMRVNWADHRQRVRDSHKVQAKAAGFEKIVKDNGSAEVPGDITVSGDKTENHYHESPQVSAAPQQHASIARRLAPYIATAALTAGALNGSDILQSFTSMFRADYEIRFYDKDGNLISVPRYKPSPATLTPIPVEVKP